MCGIAGYVGPKNRLPSLEVERRILDSLKDRGPDDEGRWTHPEKGGSYFIGGWQFRI